MKNGNGDRIWRWRKVDILFVVGIAVILYGAARGRIDIIAAGTGITALPLTQRVDKP